MYESNYYIHIYVGFSTFGCICQWSQYDVRKRWFDLKWQLSRGFVLTCSGSDVFVYTNSSITELHFSSKMPAPMENKLPPKDTFNLLARANICFSIFLIGFIYFPLNTGTRLDIIYNCPSATKTLITVIVLYNASLSNFLFRYGTQQSSTHKTNVKVSI